MKTNREKEAKLGGALDDKSRDGRDDPGNTLASTPPADYNERQCDADSGA